MSRKLANWVLDYSSAVAKMTEAPHAFNVWAAISVISAALKKRVYLNRGTFKIYPNQYIVLISPPGVGKGTAMHPAHAFAKGTNPKLVNYMSDRITAPKIIENLAKGFPSVSVGQGGQLVTGNEASCCLMATELSTLLGSSDWMTSFLCDAWDRGEFEYDTKNKGTNIVKDMCVSLMGACVPDFIRSINRDNGSAINGGFTARTIFVFAAEKSQSIPWPEGWDAKPATKKLYADLEYDLLEITKLHGEFTWTNTARILFERHYNTIKTLDSDTDVVRHFKARQSTHVCKVAMVLSAASGDSLCIDDYHINTAISLVTQVRDTLDVTFRGVGESPIAEATARVQSYMERKGVATWSEILKDNHRHVTSEDLTRVIYTLTAIGIITEATVGGKRVYRIINQP